MEKAPLAIGIIIGGLVVAAFFLLQQGAPIQQSGSTARQVPSQLDRFKASGYFEFYEGTFLLIDAGRDRGIWARYGLDPEWVYPPSPINAASFEKHVASGNKIGLFAVADVLTARYNGVPVKIVACYIGEGRANKIYVKADSPIKSMKGLDGKKIGVGSSREGALARVAIYLSNQFGIKPEFIVTGNQSSSVVALKLGKVDAISEGFVSTLRLVDSGELRILATYADFVPKPWASLCVFATEDLIEQNPDLVKRFVKATLESARYLKDNPSYVADLYIKRSNAPRDLAQKVHSQYEWTPGGRGSGADLFLAVKNRWEHNKDVGIVPADANLKIEDAVDVRFLP